jgi:hypothetical protein
MRLRMRMLILAHLKMMRMLILAHPKKMTLQLKMMSRIPQLTMKS